MNVFCFVLFFLQKYNCCIEIIIIKKENKICMAKINRVTWTLWKSEGNNKRQQFALNVFYYCNCYIVKSPWHPDVYIQVSFAFSHRVLVRTLHHATTKQGLRGKNWALPMPLQLVRRRVIQDFWSHSLVWVVICDHALWVDPFTLSSIDSAVSLLSGKMPMKNIAWFHISELNHYGHILNEYLQLLKSSPANCRCTHFKKK